MQMLAGVFCCPVCKTTLAFSEDSYSCARCRRSFPTADGVPDFFVSLSESDAIDEPNKTWLDPDIVAARNLFYSQCARELKGMAFCMREIGQRTFPGCRVLEVGMGTGHFTRWLAEVSEPGSDIFAFDMSWPIIEMAKENTSGASGLHLFRANSRGRLPVENDSFDVVLARLAPLGAHGVTNVQAAFQLLKPGGWYFEAQWEAETYETPATEFAMQQGFADAEHHSWRYSLMISIEAHRASLLELERMADLGGKKAQQAAARQSLADVDVLTSPQQTVPRLTEENLLMARKPEYGNRSS
jgi:SAM-dependent methyltransferase